MEIALGTHECYSEVMYVEWKLVLVRIEIVLVSVKDRCPVYANVLGHGNRFGHTRMVLLGNVCPVEACFGLFRDCVGLGER